MQESYKIHECDKLPKSGISIVCSSTEERENITQQVFICREATEDDLEENHYLEEEGQTIWETTLEIIYCPFCGKYLPEIGGKAYPDQGMFNHYDYSGWACEKE